MVMELYFFPAHTIQLVCKYEETKQIIQNFFFGNELKENQPLTLYVESKIFMNVVSLLS